MRNFLTRALLDELPLKMLSLAIAVTLFSAVRRDRDAATSVYTKVIYTYPNDRVLMSDPVTEVRVAVRGTAGRLQRIDERALEPLRVSLTAEENGVYRFDVSTVKLPAGVQATGITPPEVKVEFEPKVVRTITVEPVIEGQPQEGFRLVRTKADPPRVRVDGPKSVVENLGRVRTRPFELQRPTTSVVGTVALEPLPRHTHLLDGGSVKIEAEIKASVSERVLDKVAVHVARVAAVPLKAVFAVEPATVRVVVRGPEELLEQVVPEQIQLSVFAGLSDTMPPRIHKKRLVVGGVPAGLTVEVQPDTVTLTAK